MPDPWSTRLFICALPRYGFNPFRYARQRSTTVMVKAPNGCSRRLCGGQFNECARGPMRMEQTTERLIRETIPRTRRTPRRRQNLPLR